MGHLSNYHDLFIHGGVMIGSSTKSANHPKCFEECSLGVTCYVNWEFIS
jgi:hypothetical protein